MRWIRKLFTVLDTFSWAIKRAIRRTLQGGANSPERYVGIKNRLWLSDLSLSRQFVRGVQDTKWGDFPSHSEQKIPPMHWKGVPLIKDPFDLALYPLLLWELKPRTIFEVGSYLGASAVWIADLTQSMGFDCEIHSYDLDLSRVRVEHPRVRFHTVDCMKPEGFLPQGAPKDWLKTLPHPWLLIEDAHVNTRGVLEFFHPFLKSGDYWVIEDTAFILEKHDAMRAFFSSHSESYRVDTRFTDLYGYNSTFNFNGYVKRV